MTDRVSKEKRSEIMRAVKSKDTAPEMVVRKLVFSMGYRYRLHRKDLPGSPDLVFPGRKKVIFVHGCFWHGHRCKKGKPPATRAEYWLPKLEANRKRDSRAKRAIAKLGWQSLVIWTCTLDDLPATQEKLRKFLK